MENIAQSITASFVGAVKAAFPKLEESLVDNMPRVMTANKKTGGDYQFNGMVAVFNRYKKRPDEMKDIFNGAATAKDVSQQVVDKLDSTIIEDCVVTDQGFITCSLTTGYLQESMAKNVLSGEWSQKTLNPQSICVDYSSPNIAKEMHVGHLRSTIIGESITRILEEMGHKIDRINHVGDWGTQFGMLIEYMKEAHPEFDPAHPEDLKMENLTMFYKAAKVRFDEDDDFKDRARKQVYALQTLKDPFARAAWKVFCDMSFIEFEKVYDRLGVSKDLVVKGESFYNDMILDTIEDTKQYLEVVDGANCFFVDGKKKKNEVPFMIVKSDGGFGYDTTDFAAVKYRLVQQGHDRVIYVTDAGQWTHFEKLFKAASIVGWADESKKLDHVGFGLVLGEDGKKFKTRSGTVVKLVDLLDEAVERAEAVLVKRLENAPEEEKALIDVDEVARSVGYGAVKYFDLKQHRTTNYSFSYDTMLDYNGNTAVYLLYAYARVCSIFRKCEVNPEDASSCDDFTIEHDAERNLIKGLLKFPEILEQFERDLHVHNICTYLYDLCTLLTKFYSECRVFGDARQKQRLVILKGVKDLMYKVMKLLGLEPVERI